MGVDVHSVVGDTTIAYAYGDFLCKTKVSSYYNEANVKVEARIRRRAVQCKKMRALWCEEELTKHEPLKVGLGVDDELIPKKHVWQGTLQLSC